MDLQHILLCVSIVLNWCHGNKGETTSLCYIWKYNKQSILCVPPSSPVECCTREHVSVDKIEVYRKDGCDSVIQCGSANGCCTAHTLINIYTEYRAALEEAFKSTNCFNNVDERLLQSQLPKNEGLDHIIVSYTCTDQMTPTVATTKPATATTKTTPQQTPVSQVDDTDRTTSSVATATSATTATETTSQQTIVSSVADTENNKSLTVAVAVPLTIIAICVVAVTILYFKRKLSNKPSSKDGAGADNPAVSGAIGSHDSVHQYLNVVPPTYEQLSRQQTDGDYTELTGI